MTPRSSPDSVEVLVEDGRSNEPAPSKQRTRSGHPTVTLEPNALERSVVADHYVYVLECADDTLYTGYTTDPERRVAEHDAGDGAKYTRCRTPVELVYLERYDSRSAAMSREHEIKSLTRAEKEQLVTGAGKD